MSARWLAVLLLAVCLAGCGGKTPRLGKLGTADVVVAFGDSLTFGTGATAEQSYPAVLSRLIGRTVVRAGVPGELTAGGLARLPGVLDEHRPKLVILCLGGNDMLRKNSLEAAEGNLREMLQLIKTRGIDALLLGVPQPALIASAPAFYEKLAQEFGIPYESRVIASVLTKSQLKSDPVHPNAEGYRKMAEAIAALLHDAGAL